jgi:phosphopantothenoylcysteine decarboxylase/phosphopantothenate--cysteine ligase
MFIACKEAQSSLDIAVMAAAVADYTPISFSEKKVKKSDGDLKIKLERTADILKYLGDNKLEHQILIGFAMETQNEIENAALKAKNKNADFIVLNSLNEKGAGFQGDTNKVTFVYNNQTSESFKLKSKLDVAKDIANKVNELIVKNA